MLGKRKAQYSSTVNISNPNSPTVRTTRKFKQRKPAVKPGNTIVTKSPAEQTSNVALKEQSQKLINVLQKILDNKSRFNVVNDRNDILIVKKLLAKNQKLFKHLKTLGNSKMKQRYTNLERDIGLLVTKNASMQEIQTFRNGIKYNNAAIRMLNKSLKESKRENNSKRNATVKTSEQNNSKPGLFAKLFQRGGGVKANSSSSNTIGSTGPASSLVKLTGPASAAKPQEPASAAKPPRTANANANRNKIRNVINQLNSTNKRYARNIDLLKMFINPKMQSKNIAEWIKASKSSRQNNLVSKEDLNESAAQVNYMAKVRTIVGSNKTRANKVLELNKLNSNVNRSTPLKNNQVLYLSVKAEIQKAKNELPQNNSSAGAVSSGMTAGALATSTPPPALPPAPPPPPPLTTRPTSSSPTPLVARTRRREGRTL